MTLSGRFSVLSIQLLLFSTSDFAAFCLFCAIAGFDNTLVNMGATFIANGPSFLTGKQLPWLQNVDVYSLLCDRLGLTATCQRSNGTLDTFLPFLKK